MTLISDLIASLLQFSTFFAVAFQLLSTIVDYDAKHFLQVSFVPFLFVVLKQFAYRIFRYLNNDTKIDRYLLLRNSTSKPNINIPLLKIFHFLLTDTLTFISLLGIK